MLKHPYISVSWWIMVLVCSWIQFTSILLSTFALVFLRDIGLKFSFFFSLSGLGIRVAVASYNEFGNVSSLSFLWNSLRSIGVSSLKVW